MSLKKMNQHKFYEFGNCAHSTGWWTPWPWHLPEGKVFAGHAYLIWRWCLAEWNSLSWTSWNFNAKTFRENDLLKFNVFTMAMSMPLSLHGRHWTWVKLDLSAYKCVIINASKRKNVAFHIQQFHALQTHSTYQHAIMWQWVLKYSATYSHCKSSTVWICVTFSVDFVETPRLALLVRFGQVPIESTALPLMQRTDNTVSISILVDFCLQISWFKMILKSKMSPISTPSVATRPAATLQETRDEAWSFTHDALSPKCHVSLVFTCRLRLLRLRLFVCSLEALVSLVFYAFVFIVFTFRLRSFLDKAYSCYWKAIPVFRLQWLMDVQLCKDAWMGEN